MATPSGETVVPRMALFDRLSGEEPPRGARAELRALKASVLRDLSWLLNARQPIDPSLLSDPKRKDPLAGTLARFGLPDITHLDLGHEPAGRQLKGWIEDAIKAFEPRLIDVQVTWSETPGSPGRWTFQVAAKLKVEPGPERLAFDGEVHLRTGELRLR